MDPANIMPVSQCCIHPVDNSPIKTRLQLAGAPIADTLLVTIAKSLDATKTKSLDATKTLSLAGLWGQSHSSSRIPQPTEPGCG